MQNSKWINNLETLLRIDYKACTGCGACAAICSQNTITMVADEEGFAFPQLETQRCTECGLCQMVCPASEAGATALEDECDTAQVFAAWHIDDDIRFNSSSGGVFTAVAEHILSAGGVVVGAAFDERFHVRHIAVEKSKELWRLRGSKYVQSQIDADVYRKIREWVKQKRPVLFTGTPCQVAGARKYLLQPYETFFSCDLVCHGVPSPLLWAKYVEHKEKCNNPITSISFRDKSTGWKRYSMRMEMQKGRKTLIPLDADEYMLAFLRNYSLRLSCFSCKYASPLRYGDLTLGDFWGMEKMFPQYDDDKGTSLVMVNTRKGMELIDNCGRYLFLAPAQLSEALRNQHALVRPFAKPPERNKFLSDMRTLTLPRLVKSYRLQPPSFPRKFFGALKRRVFANELQKRLKRFIITKALDLAFLSCKQSLPKKEHEASGVLILPADDCWGESESHGFGDEMLVLGVLEGLKKKGFSRNGALRTGKMVPGNSHVAFYGHEVELLSFRKGFLSPPSYQQFVRIASSFSHFIVIGADILDGPFGALDAIHRLRLLNLATAMGLKSTVVGCSISRTDNSRIKSLLKTAEIAGAAIHSRDGVSLKRFQTFLNNVKLVTDVAFLVDTKRFPVAQRVRSVVEKAAFCKNNGGRVLGINLCGWHIKHLDEFFEDLIQGLLGIEDSLGRLSLILVPHDTRGNGDSDLSTLEAFFSKAYKRLEILDAPRVIRSGVDAKQVVAACDLLLTGRMHLAIAAHDQGVPSLSFGYHGKFEGFYRLYGMGQEFMVEYGNVSGVMASLERAFKQRDELSARILEHRDGIRLLAEKNFDRL